MDERNQNAMKEPWNPNSIFGMIFVLSTVIACIFLGINWEPLGKPEWKVKTILLSFLVNLGTIMLAILWLVLFAGNKNVPFSIVLLMPFVALGSNFGFTWVLSRLQYGAYKIYKKEGIEAIRDYQYDIKSAKRNFILILMGIVVFGTIILPVLGN
jgi:hypothetical protein